MIARRFVLALVLLSIISCDSNKHFDTFVNIPDSSWEQDAALQFETEIPDNATLYNLLINVRNSEDYPYSNLFVFLNTYSPEGYMQRDTIECILADKKGKWLGRGLGGIWANQIMFRKSFRFPAAGTYRFEMTHAMRDDPLPGIKDAGLRLERAETSQ